MEDAGTTRPRIEDDPEVALLLRDYAAALEGGGSPDRAAILNRWPDAAAEIAVCLDGLDFLHGVASHVHDEVERSSDALPPALLGDFRIGRELGRGGMGVVYEADQISLGRRVALKVLPFAAILDPRRLQRFRNEAQAAAHLHHSHIVPVHAVGCERGVHYYAMQLIEGTSLEEIIEELRARGSAATSRPASVTPISDGLGALAREGTHETPGFCRAVAGLGVQAAQALDYAHQQGVVHRDVKPGNLMVDAQGEVWITDFGLAMVQSGATALTRTGDLVGTLRYMSPELAAAGRLPVDHRTDIYSLGVTLYELLTLHGAFPGEEPNEVLRAIASDDPTSARRLNPAVPAELETILRKAMSKTPAERYATAREMADDLERFLEHRPILARRPSPAARAAKWARRHRGFVAASIVVLLVGSAALAVGAVRLAHEEHRTRIALEESERERDIMVQAVNNLLRQQDLGLLDPQDWNAPLALRPFLGWILHLSESLPAHDAGHLVAERVTLLSLLDNREEAVALARHAVEAERSASNLWSLAAALYRNGQREESVAAYDDVIASGDERRLAAAYKVRARVLWELGQREKALVSAKKAASLEPGSPEYHERVSAILYGLGKAKEALDSIQIAVRLDSTSSRYLTTLSALLHGLRRDDEALDAANRAINQDRRNGRAYNARGSLLLSRFQRPRDALADFDRAIELDASIPTHHFHRGNALYQLGYCDLALVSFERAIEGAEARRRSKDPMDEHEVRQLPSMHGGRADSLAYMRRFDEAVEEYARALSLDPRPDQTLHLLTSRGWTYMSMGQREKAQEEFRHALTLDAHEAMYWGQLGQAFMSLGQFEQAATALHRGMASATPPPPELLNGLAWLHATSTDAASRDPKRAVELAKEAVARAPQEGNFHNTLGVALCRLESWQDSLEAFKNSMARRNGGDPHDWLFMAIACWHLDRKDEARGLYDRSLAWIELYKQSGDLQLQRFRQEAAALLGVK